MPKLSDFNKPQKNSFKRVHYSPWDSSPSPDLESTHSTEDKKAAALNKGTDRPITPLTETGSKQVQKGFKTGSEKVLAGAKSGSIEVQRKFTKDLKEVQPGLNTGSELGSTLVQKKALEPAYEITAEDVYSLTGAQKKVLFFIVEICCAKGVLKTPPINTTALSLSLNIPKETTKTAIRRLIKKQFILKTKSKQGIGGFCCYTITETIKFYVLEVQKNEVHTGLIENKNRFELGSEIGSSLPVVSSNNIINNTTTHNNEIRTQELPNEWIAIDYSALMTKGFKNSHLIQIYNKYKRDNYFPLNVDTIQNSINAVVYDLEHNNLQGKIKAPIVSFLVKLLKDGNPYDSLSPDTFKSPEEQAIEEYLSQKNSEKKIKENKEIQAKEYAFSDWYEKLSQPERAKYSSGLKMFSSATVKEKQTKQAAYTDWEKDVWPKAREEIIAKRDILSESEI